MRKGIYKDNKRNTWYIHTCVYIDGNPRTITARGYQSKSDADKDYDRVIEEGKKKFGLESKKVFFRDLIDEVICVRKLSVKLQTVQTDKSVYNVYLLPKYGNSLIGDVFTTKTMVSWYNEITANNNLGCKRKNRIINTFRIVVQTAYEHDYIKEEVYRQMNKILKNIKSDPFEKKKEKIAWTKKEYRAFIDAIPEDSVYYPMFLLMGETGCRIGEVQGLMWKHFDANNHTIAIVQQVAEATGSGKWIIESPKTKASKRVNVISDSLTELLISYRNKTYGRDDDFIFGKYRPICRHAIRNHLQKYIAIAGVREITPHELRHTNISWMVGDPSVKTMQDIKMISERVGHTDMSTTLKTYTHVINSREKTIVNSLISSFIDEKSKA